MSRALRQPVPIGVSVLGCLVIVAGWSVISPHIIPLGAIALMGVIVVVSGVRGGWPPFMKFRFLLPLGAVGSASVSYWWGGFALSHLCGACKGWLLVGAVLTEVMICLTLGLIAKRERHELVQAVVLAVTVGLLYWMMIFFQVLGWAPVGASEAEDALNRVLILIGIPLGMMTFWLVQRVKRERST